MPKNVFGKALNQIKNKTTYSSNPDQWFLNTIGGPTTSGINVNERTALTISAYFDGINLIANHCSYLPFSVIQKDYNTGNITHKTDHQVRQLLRYEPNHYQNAREFKFQMTLWLLGWGNAYAVIEREGSDIVALHPQNPWDTEVLADKKTRNVFYDFENYDTPIHSDNVLHLKQFVPDVECFKGESVIKKYARDRFGGHIATERFGERYFRNGTHTAGVLTTEDPLHSNDKVANRMKSNIRKEFNNNYKGDSNWFEPVILQGKWDYENLTIPASDAMLIERMKVTTEDVARWLHIPVSKLKGDQNTSYNTREFESLDYVQDGLQPRLDIWEQETRKKLLKVSEKEDSYETFIDPKELLRGDLKSLGEFLSAMVTNGIMTPNQALRQLGMDTFEDGDIHFKDMNKEALEDYLERLEFKRQNGGQSNDQSVQNLINALKDFKGKKNGHSEVHAQ